MNILINLKLIGYLKPIFCFQLIKIGLKVVKYSTQLGIIKLHCLLQEKYLLQKICGIVLRFLLLKYKNNCANELISSEKKKIYATTAPLKETSKKSLNSTRSPLRKQKTSLRSEFITAIISKDLGNKFAQVQLMQANQKNHLPCHMIYLFSNRKIELPKNIYRCRRKINDIAKVCSFTMRNRQKSAPSNTINKHKRTKLLQQDNVLIAIPCSCSMKHQCFNRSGMLHIHANIVWQFVVTHLCKDNCQDYNSVLRSASHIHVHGRNKWNAIFIRTLITSSGRPCHTRLFLFKACSTAPLHAMLFNRPKQEMFGCITYVARAIKPLTKITHVAARSRHILCSRAYTYIYRKKDNSVLCLHRRIRGSQVDGEGFPTTSNQCNI